MGHKQNENILQIALLYDFYGGLLTEKQRDFFEMYHFNDFSLTEMGEELGISPQAVRDLLHRTEAKLARYEEQLGLVTKRTALLKKISDAESFAKDADMPDNTKVKLTAFLADIKNNAETL